MSRESHPCITATTDPCVAFRALSQEQEVRALNRRFSRVAQANATGVALVLTLLGCSPAAQAPATPSPTPLVTSPASLAPTPSPTPKKTPAPVVTPIAGAPDSDVILHLVAKNNRWDVTALSAPAAKTWQVEIENQDSIGTGAPHNFVVESGRDIALRIFVSPKIQGGDTQTFEIPALPAGTYLFVCTLHDNTMTGTLTLE